MYYKHHKLFGYFNRDAKYEMSKFLGWHSLRYGLTFCEAGGSGCRSLAMSKMGYKVYYIDISKEQVERVKGDNITSIQGSICDPQPIHNCDLIYCIGVIHHTEHPAKALINLAKWLKIGGLLSINCYSADYEYFFWIDLMRKLLPEISYEELYKVIPYANIEHLCVPLINYGTYDIMKHDLNKLGFKILSEHRDRVENFVVRKVSEVNVKPDELLYQPNIPINLSDKDKLKIVIDIFKQRYAPKENLKTVIKNRIKDIIGRLG